MAGVEFTGYRLVKKPRDDERVHNMSTLTIMNKLLRLKFNLFQSFSLLLKLRTWFNPCSRTNHIGLIQLHSYDYIVILKEN